MDWANPTFGGYRLKKLQHIFTLAFSCTPNQDWDLIYRKIQRADGHITASFRTISYRQSVPSIVAVAMVRSQKRKSPPCSNVSVFAISLQCRSSWSATSHRYSRSSTAVSKFFLTVPPWQAC